MVADQASGGFGIGLVCDQGLNDSIGRNPRVATYRQAYACRSPGNRLLIAVTETPLMIVAKPAARATTGPKRPIPLASLFIWPLAVVERKMIG